MSKHDDGVRRISSDDELESYLAQAQNDPAFRAAYEDVAERHSILDTLVGLRRHRGLTQTELAVRMGVRQPTVSGFETEDSDPRLSTLQRYARAVGAKLRLTLVIPRDCDWIGSGVSRYREIGLQGSTGAPVRQSELAGEWRAEKRQEQSRRWATPA